VGGTFVITLREGFEAALVLGLIYTYLDKIGARRKFRYVTTGAIVGVAASALLGLIVSLLSGPLVDLGPDLIGAAVLFAASGTLTWHGWWMRQHARAVRGELEERIGAAHARQQFWIVGVIAFTAVFREGAETVLFLWGLLTQIGARAGGTLLALGGFLGVAGAVMLGLLVFQGARQVNPRRFFAWTTVFLLLLAAGLFSTGVGRLQSLGVLPTADTLWDTSAWLDDGGFFGSLLAGLLGYRARPSTLEGAAYVAYLVGAGWLLFGGGAAPSAASAGASPSRRGEPLTAGGAQRQPTPAQLPEAPAPRPQR
jgi:high-affinity iron transporter